MAATLASVCSVPLTSVLLLFELTKDYRILLPLMVSMIVSAVLPTICLDLVFFLHFTQGSCFVFSLAILYFLT
jgi:hypothetical protein